MTSLSNHHGSPKRPTSVSSPQTLNVGAITKIAQNVVLRVGRDNLMLVAAGVAFYAMTAIFPAIAAFVSIYGLFSDPTSVQAQLAVFAGLLPSNSFKLLTDA